MYVNSVHTRSMFCDFFYPPIICIVQLKTQTALKDLDDARMQTNPGCCFRLQQQQKKHQRQEYKVRQDAFKNIFSKSFLHLFPSSSSKHAHSFFILGLHACMQYVRTACKRRGRRRRKENEFFLRTMHYFISLLLCFLLFFCLRAAAGIAAFSIYLGIDEEGYCVKCEQMTRECWSPIAFKALSPSPN